MTRELPIMATSEPPITVYVAIGNDGDRLSQGRWISYHDNVVEMITLSGTRIMADWYSSPLAGWQGHCFCIEVKVGVVADGHVDRDRRLGGRHDRQLAGHRIRPASRCQSPSRPRRPCAATVPGPA